MLLQLKSPTKKEIDHSPQSAAVQLEDNWGPGFSHSASLHAGLKTKTTPESEEDLCSAARKVEVTRDLVSAFCAIPTLLTLPPEPHCHNPTLFVGFSSPAHPA